MAKTSQINRNKKREKMVAQYATKRAELKKKPLHFDGLGLSLLVIVMVSWEVVLSKGQEWDWLGDPFWRVQTLVILFVVGLIKSGKFCK